MEISSFIFLLYEKWKKKKKNEKKHTLKKLLIFCKMELSSSKLKKLIKFQERIKKPENKKKKVILFLIKKQNVLN